MNPRREGGPRNGQKNGFAVRANYRNVVDRRWVDVSTAVVTALISICTDAGAAIMLGRTSDGGALSVCILDGDAKIKEYFREPEEVERFVSWLHDEVFANPKPLTIVKK